MPLLSGSPYFRPGAESGARIPAEVVRVVPPLPAPREKFISRTKTLVSAEASADAGRVRNPASAVAIADANGGEGINKEKTYLTVSGLNISTMWKTRSAKCTVGCARTNSARKTWEINAGASIPPRAVSRSVSRIRYNCSHNIKLSVVYHAIMI